MALEQLDIEPWFSRVASNGSREPTLVDRALNASSAMRSDARSESWYSFLMWRYIRVLAERLGETRGNLRVKSERDTKLMRLYRR